MVTFRQKAILFMLALGAATAMTVQLPWYDFGMFLDTLGMLWSIDVVKIFALFSLAAGALLWVWNPD